MAFSDFKRVSEVQEKFRIKYITNDFFMFIILGRLDFVGTLSNLRDSEDADSGMNKLYNNRKQKRQSGYHTKQDWKAIRRKIIERDKKQCQGCGKQTEKLQVHHIKPRDQGGTNELSNLIALCGRCHMTISPVPPFALRRVFGIKKSDIPAARQRVYRGINQFQKRQRNKLGKAQVKLNKSTTDDQRLTQK